MRFNVLVVDDDIISLQLLKKILEIDYNVEIADSGQSAIEKAIENVPDIILLDVKMPGLGGYEVCEILKKNHETAEIPIIFISGMSSLDDEKRGFEVGAVDYIVKPLKAPVVYHRVKNHIMLAKQQHICSIEVIRKTKQLQEAKIEQVMALMRAARFKEHETANHTIRVGLLAWLIAMDMGLGKSWAQKVFIAAPMHDIGKIGVPDEVLLSPLNLRRDKPEWWELMKKHTIFGQEIIGENLHSDIMKMASSIAMCHHEKMDGSGYPNGLIGSDIPFEARLVSIVDMIDAMMDTSRPYRNGPIPDEKIKEILVNESGVLLDKDIVESTIKNWGIIKGMHTFFSGEEVPLQDYVYLNEDELFLQLEHTFNELPGVEHKVMLLSF